MTFDPNVPQGNQQIRSTQSPIQTNFNLIGAAFNDATNGDFTKYIMNNVGTVSLPIDPDGVWHMRNGANFFLNRPLPYFSNSQGDFPLMPDLRTSTTNYGFTFGNIIVNFGSVAATKVGVLVTFAVAFNNTNYALVACPNNTSALDESSYNAEKVSATQGRIYRGNSAPAGTITTSYFAIGT